MSRERVGSEYECQSAFGGPDNEQPSQLNIPSPTSGYEYAVVTHEDILDFLSQTPTTGHEAAVGTYEDDFDFRSHTSTAENEAAGVTDNFDVPVRTPTAQQEDAAEEIRSQKCTERKEGRSNCDYGGQQKNETDGEKHRTKDHLYRFRCRNCGCLSNYDHFRCSVVDADGRKCNEWINGNKVPKHMREWHDMEKCNSCGEGSGVYFPRSEIKDHRYQCHQEIPCDHCLTYFKEGTTHTCQRCPACNAWVINKKLSEHTCKTNSRKAQEGKTQKDSQEARLTTSTIRGNQSPVRSLTTPLNTTDDSMFARDDVDDVQTPPSTSEQNDTRDDEDLQISATTATEQDAMGVEAGTVDDGTDDIDTLVPQHHLSAGNPTYSVGRGPIPADIDADVAMTDIQLEGPEFSSANRYWWHNPNVKLTISMQMHPNRTIAGHIEIDDDSLYIQFESELPLRNYPVHLNQDTHIDNINNSLHLIFWSFNPSNTIFQGHTVWPFVQNEVQGTATYRQHRPNGGGADEDLARLQNMRLELTFYRDPIEQDKQLFDDWYEQIATELMAEVHESKRRRAGIGDSRSLTAGNGDSPNGSLHTASFATERRLIKIVCDYIFICKPKLESIFSLETVAKKFDCHYLLYVLANATVAKRNHEKVTTIDVAIERVLSFFRSRENCAALDPWAARRIQCAFRLHKNKIKTRVYLKKLCQIWIQKVTGLAQKYPLEDSDILCDVLVKLNALEENDRQLDTFYHVLKTRFNIIHGGSSSLKLMRCIFDLAREARVVDDKVPSFGEYEFWSSRDFVLEAIDLLMSGHVLDGVSPELKRDRTVVLRALNVSNGMALEFAHEELKCDRGIVFAAVKLRADALKFASDEICADREFILSVVKINGSALHFCSRKLTSDKEIVMSAIMQDARGAASAIAQELRFDREILSLVGSQFTRRITPPASSSWQHPVCIALREIDQRTLTYDAAFKAVESCGEALQFVPAEYRKKKDIVLAAVKQNGKALLWAASDELQDDEAVWKNIVLTAVQSSGEALMYAGLDLQSDVDIVKEAIKTDAWALRYAGRQAQADKSIVLQAVRKNGLVLRFIKDFTIKSDIEIALEAVKSNGAMLQFLPEDLRSNKAVILEAVKENGFALQFVSTSLQSDSDIILAAVTENGLVLSTVVDDLRSRRTIVMAAVRSNGLALFFCGAAFKYDYDIVMAAVSENGLALSYASDTLRSERSVVLAAIHSSNGSALRYALLSDAPVIVIEAVQRNGLVLEYADTSPKSDKQVVLKAVQQNGLSLRFASSELREDRDVVQEAVQQNGLSLEYASPEFRKDRDVVEKAVQQNGISLEFASPELQKDRDVVEEAVQQNGLSLRFASCVLREDREVVESAVKSNGGALEFVHNSSLKTDPEIVSMAIKQNGVRSDYLNSIIQMTDSYESLECTEITAIYDEHHGDTSQIFARLSSRELEKRPQDTETSADDKEVPLAGTNMTTDLGWILPPEANTKDDKANRRKKSLLHENNKTLTRQSGTKDIDFSTPQKLDDEEEKVLEHPLTSVNTSISRVSTEEAIQLIVDGIDLDMLTFEYGPKKELVKMEDCSNSNPIKSPKRKPARPLIVKLQTTVDKPLESCSHDVDRNLVLSLRQRFEESRTEFHRLEITVQRTPRDFAILHATLLTTLCTATSRGNNQNEENSKMILPPLPNWVSLALRRHKVKKSFLIASASTASATMMGIAAFAAGAASVPLVLAAAGLAALFGSSATLASRARGKKQLRQRIHDDLAQCMFLKDLQAALIISTAPTHIKNKAILTFKRFMTHNGHRFIH